MKYLNIFFIILPNILNAQLHIAPTTYLQYTEAWSNFQKGQKEKNIEAQQKYYEKTCAAFPTYCSFLSENYAKQKKYKDAADALERSLEYSYNGSGNIEKNISKATSDTLKAKYLKILERNSKYFHINLDAIAAIKQIIKEDKAIRPSLCVKDSSFISILERQVEQADSITFFKIKDYTLRYGWPGIRLINPQNHREVSLYFLYKFAKKYTKMYYDLAIDAVDKEEESWTIAQDVIANVRHNKMKGYDFFSFFEYDEKEKIDFLKTINQIQAQVVINYLNQPSNYQIELFAFENPYSSLDNRLNMQFVYEYISNRLENKEKLKINDTLQAPLAENAQDCIYYNLGFKLKSMTNAK